MIGAIGPTFILYVFIFPEFSIPARRAVRFIQIARAENPSDVG